MKALILFVAWCILFVLCWPVALIALILLPVVWLLSLPLRLLGISVEAVLAFLRAVLLLPARLLGYKEPARTIRAGPTPDDVRVSAHRPNAGLVFSGLA